MTKKGLVTIMLMRFVFMRLILPAAFVSLFIPLLGNFFSILHLALAQLVPNSWRILVSCMVVWMSANDGGVIRRDKFLHFYRLRKSKDPDYYKFKLWDRASRLILDYPSSLRNWKPNFFFVSGNGREFILGEDLDEAPKFFL